MKTILQYLYSNAAQYSGQEFSIQQWLVSVP